MSSPTPPEAPDDRRTAGTLTGGCLCGAVRYRVMGSFGRLSVCHCRQCQRFGGGPSSAAGTVPLARFVLTEDRGLRWYASSDHARRGFCRFCGSALFWAPIGEARICPSAGSLDDAPDLGPPHPCFLEDAADYAAPEGPPPPPDPDPPPMLEGGCLCGANRFRLHGPAGEATACHCRQCARVSGHYAVSFDATGRLDWLKTDSLAHHVSPGGGMRSFCTRCGSPMTFARDGETAVEAGALPARTGGRLTRHIFTATQGRWHRLSDGLPQHPGEA
ncbi:GFA family protein [Frigidibacter sp. MR17.14]|uniref:GFA family protein n=1 Tax=Frigidibacter sp. MR17.14 TaxID=3126509 RepID=UPI003013162D